MRALVRKFGDVQAERLTWDLRCAALELFKESRAALQAKLTSDEGFGKKDLLVESSDLPFLVKLLVSKTNITQEQAHNNVL